MIFVSIDDNEVHNLRNIMSEVFGEENFAAQITVQTNPKGRVLQTHFAQSHDYVITYAKNAELADYSIKKSEQEILDDYPESDESGMYRLLELRNTHRQFGKHNRPNLYFSLFVDPSNGTVSLKTKEGYIEILPNWDDGYEGCWTWSKDKV